MEFGKHIGKGLWAFADKSLPGLYGLGLVFLVVRVLPQSEYGALAVVQAVYTLAVVLLYSLAFQPLTKFAAETEDFHPYIIASFSLGFLLWLLISLLVITLARPVEPLLNPDVGSNLRWLLNYIPLLLAAGFYRSFAIALLQAKYQVKKIFWIDAIFFLGTPGIVYLMQLAGWFDTAEDVLLVMTLTLGFSSAAALTFTNKLLPKTIAIRKDILRATWNFSKYTFGGASLYSFFSQMDVFFVTAYTGLVGAATYSAAKILTRLFDMVAQVVQMFLVPYSSKASARDEQNQLLIVAEKSLCFSSLSMVPVFILMAAFPQELLALLYSGKYDEGASIVRVLAIVAFIMPWNTVMASLLTGIGKVKQSFYATVVLLVAALAGYAVLTPMFGGLGTAISFVSSFLGVTFFLFLYVRRFVPITLMGVVGHAGDVAEFLRRKMASRFKVAP